MIDRYCGVTVPDDLEIVNLEPVDRLCTVTKLFNVPERPKFDTVVVVPEANLIVVGCTLFVMLLKVLAPLTVNIPAPPRLRL